ncbi:MAG: hypothetical protein A3A94_01145 [Candidatus Portnoybacteria bacterium RIFCSPLOWO2_01_FULL_43_11]|uniref:Membrane-bound metal-dependent hydrolase n=4 Tax=Bacteria candidate phyla TaxID=1783234 RepID=A0A1G2FS48_9BACT|nr:MAG: hypothetical protein A2713_01720 [candidate division WWE3 bacterium RIFCSPHIGHO2_01_FULL_35_17]OGZ37749.1 MAG: hypothetical protein A3E90_02530 [Candidatus Portnoybacteria bacterium RIFCSPHIGHO2_12_FULL_40_11]OGZ38115.1 MAG: hypothetical protein A3A94_01145 [Candidatus Portnoybacteria bacterium RIFCSPLOWO2_01_FULL_43_11]OGZ40853.1 MAG: hypothetical protein A3I20_02510 [Candidatus Portnoybacteria bacterium RIFCSPLOWO2_02_FULL_40_15]
MYLFLTEATHLTVGLIIGIFLYHRYKNRQLLFLSLFVSIFIDLDHFIDYFLFVDFSRFNLAEFLAVDYVLKANKIYVLFHGWEFVLLFLLLAKKIKKYQPILLTIALAVFGHLLVDQFTNGAIIFSYSFIYRFINDFSYNAFVGN